jgi:hypothetical protein
MVGEPAAHVQALRLKATGAVSFRFTNSPITRDQDEINLRGRTASSGFLGRPALPDNAPRSLGDPEVRARRRAMLNDPHMLPLTEYVAGLREQDRGEVPDFDPMDGGIHARALFLFEKPGPKTSEIEGGSGFISRNNGDRTAEATFNFMKTAVIHRKLTVLWNVIPWWNGTTDINTEELNEGVSCVKELISLLPYVRAVMLVGRKAQRARPLLKNMENRTFQIFSSSHPSPIVRGTNPNLWNAIASEWAQIETVIFDPSPAQAESSEEDGETPSSDWLNEVFQTAQANNWCIKPYCTTCGAQVFRLAIFQSASKSADSEIRQLLWADVWDGLTSLSESDRENVSHEIAEQLKNLSSLESIPEDGLRVVLMDLDRIFNPLGFGDFLDELLDATPAGNYLARMRDHTARLRSERAERGRIEAENRERREQRRIERPTRARPPRPQRDRIEDGNSPIHVFLKEFRELPPTDKLRKLAADDFAFPLEIIPRELFPKDADVSALSTEERERLIGRINNRTGRWRSLKTQLSAHP